MTNVRGRGFFHVEFRPDVGSSGEVPGLGSCVVCRSIASGRCVKCKEQLCDTECTRVHLLIDHGPAPLPVTVFAIRCKRCGTGIQLNGRKGRGTQYCSKACSARANRERWKRTA